MMLKKLTALLTSLVICSTAAIPVSGKEPAARTEAAVSVGNVNGDDKVDASDAAEILVEATLLGASLGSHFSDAQAANADLDANSCIDAADAAYVLLYTAMSGSGSRLQIEDLIHKKEKCL